MRLKIVTVSCYKGIRLMTSKEMDAFKNRLKNYNYLQDRINKIDKELSLIRYEMVGVKGINFDYRVSSTNIKLKDQRKLELLEKHDSLVREKTEHIRELDKLNRMLIQTELYRSQLIIEKYVNKRTYSQLSKKYHMAVSVIKYNIDKAMRSIEYI